MGHTEAAAWWDAPPQPNRVRLALSCCVLLGGQVAAAGVEWAWAGVKGMRFKADGVLVSPWGEGKWGAREDDFNCPEPHDRCLYADFANSNHNLYFPPGDQTFVSKRVGDGEVVQGARVH
jgi:hypothetical protein